MNHLNEREPLMSYRIDVNDPATATVGGDAEPETEHESRERRRGRLLGWQHRFISAMGWAFDAFSVLISLTDVVSDVLVAIQFWQDGHHLWAWLVYGCFINSNLVYSVMIVLFAIKYPNSTIDSQRIPQWFRDLPFVLLVVIVFPFAQLAPSGNYILQTFFVKHDSDDEGDYGSPAKPDVSGKTSRVGRLVEDENAAIRHDEATVGRLLKAVKKQVHTHGMLFAETIVESIPQSIVQLLAITFLGNPTTLQVVSMVLSVMSVVTKGYFVALSCSTKIVISKFFIVAFDLLSMFYIFSSVLAEDRPREVAVFGSSLEVSMLSYVWLIKLCVGVAMSALFTLIGGVSLILGKSRETLGQYLLVATIAVLGQIPALLAFEAAKLSWIIGLVFPIEPHGSGLEASTVTFSFQGSERVGCSISSPCHGEGEGCVTGLHRQGVAGDSYRPAGMHL